MDRFDPGNCLSPFHRAEAITPHIAAKRFGICARTARRWAAEYGLGRKVGGRWLISAPACLMFVEGDYTALEAYLSGERQDSRVAGYFWRLGISKLLLLKEYGGQITADALSQHEAATTREITMP